MSGAWKSQLEQTFPNRNNRNYATEIKATGERQPEAVNRK